MSFASTACPEPDAAAKREFQRTTKAPGLDTVGTDGQAALSRGRLKEKADELRASEVRKNAAGNRVIRDYERCRSGAGPSPTS